MQNAELIFSNTTTEQANTETTSLQKSQHRALVIQAWIGIVGAIVLYSAWLAL